MRAVEQDGCDEVLGELSAQVGMAADAMGGVMQLLQACPDDTALTTRQISALLRPAYDQLEQGQQTMGVLMRRIQPAARAQRPPHNRRP